MIERLWYSYLQIVNANSIYMMIYFIYFIEHFLVFFLLIKLFLHLPF